MSAIKYVLFLTLVTLLVDVVVLRHIFGFGYHRHFDEENIQRSPAPYVMFTGKPNAADHNELGFRGPSFEQAPPDAFRIAFFGGSTSYFGNPPIPEKLEEELDRLLPFDSFVASYAVLSSNHRQHLHAIVEYLLATEVDLVVFYGGYNETIQTMIYDPRPGYPYNYFFRGELGTIWKLLMEHSAILGTIDRATGVFSGRRQLRQEHQPLSEDWNDEILGNYFETLDFARQIAGSIPSLRCGNAQFLAFYQPYRVPEEFVSTHERIKRSAESVDYVVDVSSTYDVYEEDVFKDRVHVKQYARDLMAKRLAELIVRDLFEDDSSPCRSPLDSSFPPLVK